MQTSILERKIFREYSAVLVSTSEPRNTPVVAVLHVIKLLSHNIHLELHLVGETTLLQLKQLQQGCVSVCFVVRFLDN